MQFFDAALRTCGCGGARYLLGRDIPAVSGHPSQSFLSSMRLLGHRRAPGLLARNPAKIFPRAALHTYLCGGEYCLRRRDIPAVSDRPRRRCYYGRDSRFLVPRFPDYDYAPFWCFFMNCGPRVPLRAAAHGGAREHLSCLPLHF